MSKETDITANVLAKAQPTRAEMADVIAVEVYDIRARAEEDLHSHEPHREVSGHYRINLTVKPMEAACVELRKTCAGCASRRLGSMATGITTVSSYPFDVCALTRSRISDDWFCAGWEAADV